MMDQPVRSIESEQFYNLCQAYRHAPITDQVLTASLYRELIVYIDADFDAIVGAKDEQWRKTNAEYERVSKALCLAGKERDALRAQYNELIYAVGNKYPNETRHETALRYIRRAEQSSGTAKQALAPAPAEGGGA